MEVWNEAARWLLGAQATAQQYQEKFGIDPRQYPNWWVEVGRDNALSGTAQARKALQPIFTIRCSHRGNFNVVRQAVRGFCSPDESTAWVNTQQWEALLGDDSFEQADAAADRIRQVARREALLLKAGGKRPH